MLTAEVSKLENKVVHGLVADVMRPLPDVVLIEFGEPGVEERTAGLRARLGERLHVVSNVVGIANAHAEAARTARSSVFYVVDGDTDVDETFDFSYVPTLDQQGFTHIWKSRNVFTRTAYGHGGVKMFNRSNVLSYAGSSIDFSTSVAGIVMHDEVVSTEAFHVDKFSAWRTAFREAAKLTLDGSPEATSRLSEWLDPLPAPNHEAVRNGAEMGRVMALSATSDHLACINDFNLLRRLYVVLFSS